MEGGEKRGKGGVWMLWGLTFVPDPQVPVEFTLLFLEAPSAVSGLISEVVGELFL